MSESNQDCPLEILGKKVRQFAELDEFMYYEIIPESVAKACGDCILSSLNPVDTVANDDEVNMLEFFCAATTTETELHLHVVPGESALFVREQHSAIGRESNDEPNGMYCAYISAAGKLACGNQLSLFNIE